MELVSDHSQNWISGSPKNEGRKRMSRIAKSEMKKIRDIFAMEEMRWKKWVMTEEEALELYLASFARMKGISLKITDEFAKRHALLDVYNTLKYCGSWKATC